MQAAWATNILNAANEIAVAAFLAGRIGFLEIAGLVEQTIERIAAHAVPAAPETVEEVLALDSEGRAIARRTGAQSRRSLTRRKDGLHGSD